MITMTVMGIECAELESDITRSGSNAPRLLAPEISSFVSVGSMGLGMFLAYSGSGWHASGTPPVIERSWPPLSRAARPGQGIPPISVPVPLLEVRY